MNYDCFGIEIFKLCTQKSIDVVLLPLLFGYVVFLQRFPSLFTFRILSEPKKFSIELYDAEKATKHFIIFKQFNDCPLINLLLLLYTYTYVLLLHFKSFNLCIMKMMIEDCYFCEIYIPERSFFFPRRRVRETIYILFLPLLWEKRLVDWNAFIQHRQHKQSATFEVDKVTHGIIMNLKKKVVIQI